MKLSLNARARIVAESYLGTVRVALSTNGQSMTPLAESLLGPFFVPSTVHVTARLVHDVRGPYTGLFTSVRRAPVAGTCVVVL